MDRLLDFLEALPPGLVYVVLGLGAATENVLPPVPADTFVLFGGFVAARGIARVEWVFVATWLSNVASAYLVYLVGYRHGIRFFQTPLGSRVLSPGQLDRVDAFYERWGVLALFGTRFLPGLRAVVPVFAGVARLRGRVVAPPMLLASAVWYGALTYLGATAGANLEEIQARVSQANRAFLLLALLLIGLLLLWWRRTRSAPVTAAETAPDSDGAGPGVGEHPDGASGDGGNGEE